jgi:hypothetical protein
VDYRKSFSATQGRFPPVPYYGTATGKNGQFRLVSLIRDLRKRPAHNFDKSSTIARRPPNRVWIHLNGLNGKMSARQKRSLEYNVDALMLPLYRLPYYVDERSAKR